MTNTTDKSQKYTDDELRDDWDARIEKVQHRPFKRRHAAAMDEPDIAKCDALGRARAASCRLAPPPADRLAEQRAPLPPLPLHAPPRRRIRQSDCRSGLCCGARPQQKDLRARFAGVTPPPGST